MIKKLQPFSNVAANSLAICELPRGDMYHKIVLEMGGTSFDASHITKIQAKLNGKAFYTISGSNLKKINAYKGQTVTTNYITIDFVEHTAKNTAASLAGAINTADPAVTSFFLEVEIGAATAPTLSGRAVTSAGDPKKPLGLIAGLIEYPLTYAAGGEFMFELPHGPQAGMILERLHMFGSTLTTLTIKRNGLPIWDEVSNALLNAVNNDYGFSKQTDHHVADFVMNGDVTGAVATGRVQSFSVWPTVSGSGNLTAVSEVLGLLQNF